MAMGKLVFAFALTASVHAQIHTGAGEVTSDDVHPPGRRLQLTSDEKDALLKKHNDLRRAQSVPCTASDMETLVWDDTLAAKSQDYAEKCIWGHDPTNSANGWGENLAYKWSSAGNAYDVADLTTMAQGWYDEIEDTEWSADKTSVKSKTYADPATKCKSPDGSGACMIGHYTQVIWAKTNKIGCGVVACSSGLMGKGGVYLVCKYTPAGNMGVSTGEGLVAPYIPGKGCASCGSCASAGGSLCAANDKPGRCADTITTMVFSGTKYTTCASLIEAVPNYCTMDSNKICEMTCKSCTINANVGGAFAGATCTGTSSGAAAGGTTAGNGTAGGSSAGSTRTTKGNATQTSSAKQIASTVSVLPGAALLLTMLK